MSNSNNEQAIEQEIQDKGLNAPRLTPALIDATIDSETYTVLPSGRVTICEQHGAVSELNMMLGF